MNNSSPNTKLWKRLFRGFLFWTVVALFFSTQRYLLLGAEEGGWATALRFSFPQWYVWGALSPFVIRSDGWARNKDPRGRRLLVHVPLALFFVSVYVVIRHVIDIALGNYPSDWSFAALAPQYHWNFLIYAVIVGVLAAYESHEEASRRALSTSRLQTSLAEARLETLKTRLQPHFLFNSLNAISAFMERDPNKARRMMAHLGDLLRHSLDTGSRQEIPLADEMKLLDDYLAIQEIRFEGRLRVEKDVAAETLSARVPSLLLQPLVENAIEHGLVGKSAPGCITLRSRRVNAHLELTVMDDGVGLPSNGLTVQGEGLRNTEQRLYELYGDASRLEVRNREQSGVTASVEIPWRGDG